MGRGWRSTAACLRASHFWLAFFQHQAIAAFADTTSKYWWSGALHRRQQRPDSSNRLLLPSADPLLRPEHPETALSLPLAPSSMASTVRRRGPPVMPASESSSEAPAPREESPAKPGEKVKVIHHRARPRKRGVTAIFLLGSLFGLIGAGFFAKNNDLIAFPEFGELSMESLFDVLPATFMKDIRELVVRMTIARPRLLHLWS